MSQDTHCTIGHLRELNKSSLPWEHIQDMVRYQIAKRCHNCNVIWTWWSMKTRAVYFLFPTLWSSPLYKKRSFTIILISMDQQSWLTLWIRKIALPLVRWPSFLSIPIVNWDAMFYAEFSCSVYGIAIQRFLNKFYKENSI